MTRYLNAANLKAMTEKINILYYEKCQVMRFNPKFQEYINVILIKT